MLLLFTTTSTDCTVTLTTTNTASTPPTYHLIKPRSPEKMPPKPPPLRAGDTVRATCDGVLKGRVGTIRGFMDVEGPRIAFVGWPEGGWTTITEANLDRVGKKEK